MDQPTLPAQQIIDDRRSAAWIKQTVWDRLVQVAPQAGAREALIAVDADRRESRINYPQLLERSERTAAGLLRIGVRRGDRVALWMTNRIDWACIYLATLRIGAILVPLNTWLKADEAAYVIHHSRARHLILLDQFRSQDYVAIANQICPELARSRPGYLYSEAFPELRCVITLSRTNATFQFAFDLSEVERLGADFREDNTYTAAVEEVSPADPAIIKYTSGSTGRPKGAVLEQWGFVTMIQLQAERLRFDKDTRLFTSAPFFHNSGNMHGLMRMLLTGGTLVFAEAHDAELEVDLIERERCNAQWNVPSVVRDQIAVLRSAGKRLALDWTMGLAPENNKEIYELYGVRTIVNLIGITEGYGPQCLVSPDDPQEKRDVTGGKPLPGIEFRVVDPDSGADIERGGSGEAWTRGLVMRGYFDDAETTRRTVDAQGWLHTGDLVSVDRDGYYKFVGRIKAMLKVSGENVACEEVEDFIRSIAGVLDCCVVGVPDAKRDEVPFAYVSLRPGAVVSTEHLLNRCKEGLAWFKVPRYLEIVDAIPLLANNKIDRKSLKDRARQSSGAATPGAVC